METKNDNKYMNGKIYSIRSYQTDKIYIGSTVQPLHKRLFKHRNGYKHRTTNKKNMSSFEIIKFDDNYIELIEDYPCDNKNQLHRREGELIRQNISNAVNRLIAGRTHEEYYAEPENKIRKAVNARKNYDLNIDAKKEYGRDYYESNKKEIQKHRSEDKYICACGSSLRTDSTPRHVLTTKHQKYLMSIVA